ncbi:MAG: hypothetical protein HXY20_14585 [Acidobacteria bacterium]|nr:hypothetical protein [Acidobacteriota bacterium]
MIDARKLKIAASLPVLIAVPLLAGKFWDDKEFTTWSDRECREMLTKSPWAYSNSFGEGSGPLLTAESSIPDDRSGAQFPQRTDSFPGEMKVIFEFRLLTAKPIRMAMARMQLLQRPNDPSVLQQAMNFVNAPPGNQIAFQITYKTSPPGSSVVHDIHNYFLSATLAEFRTDTYLSSGGSTQIPIQEYLSPGPNRSSPAFLFPRFNPEGQPLFGPEDKSISLRTRLEPTVGGKKKKYDVYIKLNPKQMKLQGQFFI